jgi:hypothetical protein
MQAYSYFSFYRYHAPVGEFPFAIEGSYTFPFSGLPAEDMSLQFYVPGYTTSNRQAVETLSTELHATITDASGRVVCSAVGRPLGRRDDDKWTLMSSLNEAALWHHACLKRQFSRNTDYTLRVAVRSVDPRTPYVTLKAMLEGGGIELP